MINSLKIKNVALIEEAEMEFCAGLNIITGETGAGKSMIADSLNFILGQKPPKDFIRAGAECAEVCCVLEVSDFNKEKLTDAGADIDDDNLLIINRTLTDAGKSVCKINGKTSSVGMVKEIAQALFDMHGQHEHQSLLKASGHIDILDKFCGGEADGLKSELGAILKEIKNIDTMINEIGGDAQQRERRLDLYSFQIDEIERAELKPGEDDELLSRQAVLNNAEEIERSTKAALEALSGDASAQDSLGAASNFLNRLSSLDPFCGQFSKALENVSIQLDELIRDIRGYRDGIEYDGRELSEIEGRLDLIYGLKKKYGSAVCDILKFLDKTKEAFDTLTNASERLERLNGGKRALEQKAFGKCGEISALRKAAARDISQKIAGNLKELQMKDAQFAVSVERKEGFSDKGYDRVEFMISANAGEELKPLAVIASGGEISRVMLALKTVLSDADTIETFVFDEIDTGVSGRTAQKVAEKLAFLSRARQLICVTHLPQIAAMANRHFLVEKKSASGKTSTSAHALDEEKIITELARLIGGAKITDATVAAAAELREMAVGG